MQKYVEGQDLHFLKVANINCTLMLKPPLWLIIIACDSIALKEECHFNRESIMNEVYNEQKSLQQL